MDNVFYDANVIYDAGTKAIKGSPFKYATQLFEMDHLLYTAMIQKSLQDGTYTPDSGKKFLINERGKTRYITSNSMKDKVVNHMICDHILTPALGKYLIYDNGASQKGKGVRFHRERFEVHLRQYFQRYKPNEGYILLVDFSGYYANIPHDMCLVMLDSFLDREVTSPEERRVAKKLIHQIFQTFRVDVSRFSDEEIQRLREGKLNPMLNYRVNPALLTGEKFLGKGVDIGNQISQNIGLIYPYRLDNYAKIVRGVKGYGRYTDDFYAIAPDREFLKSLLEGFRKIASEYGLLINERKTRIVKLSSFFRHLQDGYSLTETGRVVRKINPKNVTRERRKLKAYKRLLDKGRMAYEDIEVIYKGWIGANWKRMSRQQLFNMNDLYIRLFRRKPKWKKGHSRLRWLMEHPSPDWNSMATTSSAKPK